MKVHLFQPDDFSTTRMMLEDMKRLDVIVVGAGVRTVPSFLPYFERLINFIHENAPPTTRVCFNTSPADTVQAAERWLSQ